MSNATPLADGYCWLKAGEMLEPGDEFLHDGRRRWEETIAIGHRVLCSDCYRRKIPPLANGYRLAAGYRWLEAGETLETGDEYHSGYDFWAITGFVGKRVNEGQVYRRKLQPPTPFHKMMEDISRPAVVTRPPLGLVPRNIWIDKRKAEVIDAIHRYLDAKLDVPAAWLEELIELTNTK